MAAAALMANHITPDRLRRAGKFVLAALVTAIIGGLVAGVMTYRLTSHLNAESTLEQQRLAALQQFVSTGAELDASVTDLADAVVDRADTTAVKQEVRRAIAAHASASEGLKEVIGRANMDAYMKGLGTLRDFVDQAQTPASTMDASQARFDIMANRSLIVKEARRVIYS